jgi:hypothetical protein
MIEVPEGRRIRLSSSLVFAFHYAAEERRLPDRVPGNLLFGEATLRPAGVAIGTAQ